MKDVKRKIKEIKDKGILQKNPNKNIDLKKRNFFKKSVLGLTGIGGLALLSKIPLVKPWTFTTSDISEFNSLSTDTISEKTADTGVTIDGVVLKDSGITAAGLGLDAISGIIETDGTYIDCEVFGPAVDGYDWDERTAASTSKLMLATIKDAGDDTTVEIWDLTDPNVIGGSALASVTITGAATPTSVAAAMGYIIVG